MTPLALCIVCANIAEQPRAAQFAAQHQLPVFARLQGEYAQQLCFNAAHVELYDSALDTAIHVDFTRGVLAHRQRFGGGRGQAIAKAIGLKQGRTPSVLDVTAGLARDAWVLATLGCKVTLVERSAVLAALLHDGILRAQTHAASASILRNNFTLHQQDAVYYMQTLTDAARPDVIYIDPMYPERKKSALVKKDMQILQHLLGKDDNATSLLATALGCARKRVVVKRPAHADVVAGDKPATSISSKNTRYDIYAIEKI